MSGAALRGGAPEAVLLDAGGVLLDLDYAYLRRLIQARHGEVEIVQLSELEAQARREIHAHVNNGGRVSEAWRDYFHIILGRVGVPAGDQPAIIDSLWEAHERVGLWTVPIPGALEAVAELKAAGYRLGVVSNAEGKVAQALETAGYCEMFETVVDSHLVGVEKPEPGIFRIAMTRMGILPERSVYCGDVPAVDVAGARAAGLTPVLLDRHGLYPDEEVDRLSSISELPRWLSDAGGSDATG